MCLVTEDAAMVAVAFGAYLFLFEPERRRDGAAAAAVAVAYLAVVLGVIQPAARAELTLSSGTTTALIVGKLFHLQPRVLFENLKSLLPALTVLPALGLAAALFEAPDAAGWARLAALAALAALPHWGESVVVGGAHHLIPPFWACYLALLSLLGGARRESRFGPGAAAWLVVYAALSVRALAGNMPSEVKLPLLRLVRPVQAAALAKSLAGERASNTAVSELAHSLPAADSLCFLGNVRATGFVFDRSDAWEFPDQCGRVRFVLVQKDAIDVNFVLHPAAGESLSAALVRVTRKENAREVPLDPAVTALLRSEWVDKARTHRVAREDEHVLLLENLAPNPPASPATTVGFGWTANVGRRALRVK